MIRPAMIAMTKAILLSLAVAALSAATASASEPLSADSLTAAFLDYYAKVPQEKIYVHTDRGDYAAGDSIWFRIFVVDAASNKLSDRSKFAYLELIDNTADTLVTRIKIKADSAGIFANAMPLSPRMKSGSYTLAAYTRWMQNFEQDLFFKKSVNVVNPDEGIAQPVVRSRVVNSIALDVMPEGGNLLAGLPQRIAYKAIADDGRGIDVRVWLLNAAGDVISESASQHLGMGYLWVTAEAGEELWLEASTADGLACRTKLSEAQTRGASLSVNQRMGTVLIQPSVTPSIDITRLALVVAGSGNLLVKELTDRSPIRISSRNLKPGVINIALIDRSSNQPLAERLIFVRDTDLVDMKATVAKSK